MSTMPLPTAPASERPSGRHPVNVGHLVMGIAFLGLVGIWAVIQADGVDDDDIRWLLPIPWVLAGLAGLLAMSVSSRRKWSTRQVGWVEPDDGPVAAETPQSPEIPESPEENR